MRDACDIDKLRDLIRRQHSAKRESYGGGFGGALDTAEVERQLLTYLQQGVTVAAFEKCVKEAEAESVKRVKSEREKSEQRERTDRIRQICDAAMELALGKSVLYEPVRTSWSHSVWNQRGETYPTQKGRQPAHGYLIKDCEQVKKEMDDA